MENIKKYAWYFPNWHPTAQNDRWHGKGWTEWECTKYARPRFEGHSQPKIPLWGCENEADPAVMEKKIRTARQYGLDGFIFDFYWFKEGGAYRRDCLDKGFLGAPSNEEMEFSVMWCNHDPIYVHPAHYMHQNVELLSGDIDAQLMYEVTEYCIRNYFCRPNYQRVDGKMYFGIWNMEKFVANFGGIDGAAILLRDFRSRARAAGYELHLAASRVLMPGAKEKNAAVYEDAFHRLGLDSVFTYSWKMPECRRWPKVEYADYREYNMTTLGEDTAFARVPMDITVSTGWDSSPRTTPSDIYEPTGFPYNPIVVNNTPAEVEKAFRQAKEFIESGTFTGNMLTVSTWNEWTEGNYLEPDEEHGYGFLEAMQNVFG